MCVCVCVPRPMCVSAVLPFQITIFTVYRVHLVRLWLWSKRISHACTPHWSVCVCVCVLLRTCLNSKHPRLLQVHFKIWALQLQIQQKKLEFIIYILKSTHVPLYTAFTRPIEMIDSLLARGHTFIPIPANWNRFHFITSSFFFLVQWTTNKNKKQKTKNKIRSRFVTLRAVYCRAPDVIHGIYSVKEKQTQTHK